MKKSKAIKLVLITAALASCADKKKADNEWGEASKTYVRSDSTAPYYRTHHGSGLLWYYAFRPYGSYAHGAYARAGYYSGGIPHTANIGSNGAKGNIVRGGFGRSGYSSVSS